MGRCDGAPPAPLRGMVMEPLPSALRTLRNGREAGMGLSLTQPKFSLLGTHLGGHCHSVERDGATAGDLRGMCFLPNKSVLRTRISFASCAHS